VAAIAERLLAADVEVLASRATREHHQAVLAIAPDAEYHEAARMIVCNRKAKEHPPGQILVVCAS